MKMRILFAEDEPGTARLVTRALERVGYEVVYAPDGASAWELLNQPNAPRLALLDWMMPGMEGLEICRRLKEAAHPRPIYTIILTGRSERADLVQALEAGADDFIPKPVNLEELRVRVGAGARIVSAQERLEQLNSSLEEAVKERTSQLEDALQAATQASQAKSSFLANMSHEIRTPLNGIVSYVELLLYSELTEEQRTDLETIRSCVSSLKHIINEVLDFSKIEADRMVIEHAEFSLPTAVQESVSIFKAKAEENDETLVLQITDDVPSEVLGDRTRVQQILSNLISNAVKFCSPHGGVIVRVSKVEETGTFTTVRFSVSDTGIGIPADKQASLFDSFAQAHSSTTRCYGGTGLGLAISRRLAELMNGRIWFKSREGVGSVFHVEIPFETEALLIRHIEQTIAFMPPDKASRGNGRSVLLAEDNDTNLHAMARVLEHRGFKVTKTTNGQGVLDLIKDQQFDVVLLDIQMPVLGGEETLARIRASDAPFATIPVVALTANAVTGDQERYLRNGFDTFVSKPIDYDNLLNMIDKAIADRSNPTPARPL